MFASYLANIYHKWCIYLPFRLCPTHAQCNKKSSSVYPCPCHNIGPTGPDKSAIFAGLEDWALARRGPEEPIPYPAQNRSRGLQFSVTCHKNCDKVSPTFVILSRSPSLDQAVTSAAGRPHSQDTPHRLGHKNLADLSRYSIFIGSFSNCWKKQMQVFLASLPS